MSERLSRTIRRSLPTAIMIFVALLFPAPSPGAETPKPSTPPLAIVAVTAAPADAAADTLCQLGVDIANKGDRIASELAFAVKVNGHDLPVYRNQLFMQRLDPGKTTTVGLYNFWTTETGRPAPADGKYRIEVTLLNAKWYDIALKDNVEEWTPRDPVPNLPTTATTTVGK
ncbi:MAG TPA: hypothetical protein VFS60_06105 [Thermoanaerobaculia bacterium]|nr:hypothetical protein [Thermoanaerobaculia bacterium]